MSPQSLHTHTHTLGFSEAGSLSLKLVLTAMSVRLAGKQYPVMPPPTSASTNKCWGYKLGPP